MAWTFLNPKFDLTATHANPRTVCEETVAKELVAFWKSDAAKDPTVTCLADTEWKPTSTVWLDLGGIVHKDRHIYTLDPIDGLTITIAAEDVQDYLNTLCEKSEKQPEMIGGKGYYTLPSMHVGVLLSVDQCIILAARLRAKLPEAQAIASAENERFNRDLRGLIHANKRPTLPTGEA